jgi:hypothetical protein
MKILVMKLSLAEAIGFLAMLVGGSFTLYQYVKTENERKKEIEKRKSDEEEEKKLRSGKYRPEMDFRFLRINGIDFSICQILDEELRMREEVFQCLGMKDIDRPAALSSSAFEEIKSKRFENCKDKDPLKSRIKEWKFMILYNASVNLGTLKSISYADGPPDISIDTQIHPRSAFLIPIGYSRMTRSELTDNYKWPDSVEVGWDHADRSYSSWVKIGRDSERNRGIPVTCKGKVLVYAAPP